MFSTALVIYIVCLFVSRITQNYSTGFSKIRWKVACGPRKKVLNFGGNPDHTTLGLGLGLGLGGAPPYSS